MPHNPAFILRLLYGEHYRRKNRAEAFSLNPATNSLTSALPIGQGLSMLRSRFPDLVVDLLPFEIVAQSIPSLRQQFAGNPRLPTTPFERSCSAAAFELAAISVRNIVSWLQYALLKAQLSAIEKAFIVFTGTLALSWIAIGVIRRVPAVARLI
jgi:hypothetical protein